MKIRSGLRAGQLVQQPRAAMLSGLAFFALGCR